MKRVSSVISYQLSVISIFLLLTVLLCGCATEYYEPKDSNFTQTEDKIYGPVKREGFISWSNGIGKNLPLANPSFSVIGE
jgi:PBP1b-binding outer membrane lipoprotein LpoB